MTTTIQNTGSTILQDIETSDANDNKFLTFRLGHEEYGAEILSVREIIGVIDITPLPQTPDYVKGVINLRGKIIPVIELRTKFGMPPVEYTDATCVIVIEVSSGDSDTFQMGVIVDTVREVRDIPRANIEPAPKFGCSINTDYILGMGKVKTAEGNLVVILLDIDKVLTAEDLADLAQTANTAAEAQDAAT